MAVDKLSVSFDADLAALVREAAADEGVTLSAWLSAAAHDRVRNRLLRLALDAAVRDGAPLDPDETARLVGDARRRATVTRADAAA